MSQERTLRTYRPGDEEQIQRLFAVVFGAERSLEEWQWRFREAPFGPAFIQVIEDSGQIVGHYAHVPFGIFVNERRHRLAHGGDMMVRRDLRKQGLMRMLVEDYVENLKGFDLRMNFPSDEAARLSGKYGGGRLIGQMNTWMRYRPFPRGERLRELRDVPRGLVGYAVSRLNARSNPSLQLVTVDEPDGRFDDLAERSARFAPCIRIRDAAYVEWRWLRQPHTSWKIIAACDGSGVLRGWVAYGVDHGSRPFVPPGGYVVDLLAEDFSTTRLLLAEAADRLVREGSMVVYLDYADPRPWAARACRAAGFITKRRGPNVNLRAFSEPLSATVEDLQHWYLTRGDTDFA